MADTPKFFQAFLNGVYLRVFNNDDSITPETLHEQIFSSTETSLEGRNDGGDDDEDTFAKI
jgi:hypothetical protein